MSNKKRNSYKTKQSNAYDRLIEAQKKEQKCFDEVKAYEESLEGKVPSDLKKAG